MLRTYRKITTIQAEQFYNGIKQIKKYNIRDKATENIPYHEDRWTLPTLEGNMQLLVGDWIATDVEGEHWAIADDVFRKTYEKVTGTVDIVSDYPGREITFSEVEE